MYKELFIVLASIIIVGTISALIITLISNKTEPFSIEDQKKLSDATFVYNYLKPYNKSGSKAKDFENYLTVLVDNKITNKNLYKYDNYLYFVTSNDFGRMTVNLILSVM
jgi:hypothetical protein